MVLGSWGKQGTAYYFPSLGPDVTPGRLAHVLPSGSFSTALTREDASNNTACPSMCTVCIATVAEINITDLARQEL